MKLVGSRGQATLDYAYDASGTIATGGTAQLILPRRKSTSFFWFQNISDTDMYLDFGAGRATATLTSGAVSSLSITNAGFGFTKPPIVTFLGGGNTSWNQANSAFLGCGQPNYPAPGVAAQATAVLTTGAISSFQIGNPGVSYAKAPYVQLVNDENDPFGCSLPSATSGFLIGAQGGDFYVNGTACFNDPIAVYCATTGKAFTCKWMD